MAADIITKEDLTGDRADIDANYFKSYEDICVHKTMLQDSVRVLAYKQFMEKNRELFSDKIVVDIGSGTGILALLAAFYGAKHVYAVEAAENMSALCKDIIKLNGYADRITVLSGRAEEVELPGGMLADVLISEWMGFYLLHESMIGSVIAARDRLLRPGGAIFPSAATIYACPVSVKEFCRDNFDFWRDVYGFDFSPAGQLARSCCLLHPEIMAVSKQSLLAEPQVILNIDLQFVGIEDVHNIMTSLDFVINRNDVMHGLALWFDVTFDGSHQIVLDTGPSSPLTHWKQTVVLLPDALLVNNAANMQCRILLQQAVDGRKYNITVEMPQDTDSEEDNEDNDSSTYTRQNDDGDDVKMSGLPENSADLQKLILCRMDKVV
jgi:protein arginine N-methyltransferase 1